MNDTNTTKTTQTYTIPNYTFCGNRLPCGVCKLMQSMCPVYYGANPWEVTCGVSNACEVKP